MLKLKQSLKPAEEGFTLIEVLVAILITSVFVAVAMQAMVLAAVFKARAREFAEATIWIQEDLENLKYKADSFEYTSLTADAISGTPSIIVASVANFAVNDSVKVGSDTINYTINGIVGTQTLNITPNLATAQAKDAGVVRTTRCRSSVLVAAANSGVSSINVAAVNNFTVNDSLKVGSDTTTYTINGITVGTQTLNITPNLAIAQAQDTVVSVVMTLEKGFADALRDNIAGSNQTGNTNFSNSSITSLSTNKPFTLKKTITIADTAPYNVLQINYDVFPTSGGLSVAKFYTEVLPNAALQCP